MASVEGLFAISFVLPEEGEGTSGGAGSAWTGDSCNRSIDLTATSTRDSRLISSNMLPYMSLHPNAKIAMSSIISASYLWQFHSWDLY
jgi:hypothetical protein